MLYSVTNDPDHLEMARYFEKPYLLGPLAINKDQLTTLHVRIVML